MFVESGNFFYLMKIDHYKAYSIISKKKRNGMRSFNYSISATNNGGSPINAEKVVLSENKSPTTFWYSQANSLDFVVSFQRKVFLTSYSMENAADSLYRTFIKSFSIHGSNDRENWDLLDI